MVSSKKSEEKKTSDFSVYLPYAFAIVLFVVAAFLSYNLSSKADLLTNKVIVLEQRMADFEISQPKKTSVKIYYSGNCSVCSNFSDMTDYLQRNDVIYELIDISTNESAANYTKQIGIPFFPSLVVYMPDVESNVGLYKLTQDKIATNDYFIIRLGSVGYYPWGEATNQTYFFYSETCSYSSLQKTTLETLKVNYTSVCIQIHTGDDQKCKDVWGSDEYLEFTALQAIYKVRETPTFVVDGKYIIVGYHPVEQFQTILDSLKKI